MQNKLSWQTDVELWVNRHKNVPNHLTQHLIRFFELAFEHTRCSDEAWFGVHQQTVSLVVGGIFLAAINLSHPDYGIWILLDQDPVVLPKVEYKPVKSTKKYYQLIWAHLNDIENVDIVLQSAEFWQSYSKASKKIFDSPISHSRNSEFQRRRNKQRLNDFWDHTFKNQYDPTELQDTRQKIESEGFFNVESLEDARHRVMASIVQRQGQNVFRRKLITAYNGQCPFTGCDAQAALEAAHIFPYLGSQTNHLTNGLPLRADIHTLFDLHLLSIQPESYEIVLAPELMETCYQELAGRKLTLPRDESALPSREAIGRHYALFLEKHGLGHKDITSKLIHNK